MEPTRVQVAVGLVQPLRELPVGGTMYPEVQDAARGYASRRKAPRCPPLPAPHGPPRPPDTHTGRRWALPDCGLAEPVPATPGWGAAVTRGAF